MFFNFKGESFSDLRTVFAFASLVPQLEGGFFTRRTSDDSLRRAFSIQEVDMRFVFALFAGLLASLSGFAQSPTTPPTITTYAGPRLPVSGAPAVTQAIDGITSVASDGAGGFYVANKNQNRVYRVTADGVLNLVAS